MEKANGKESITNARDELDGIDPSLFEATLKDLKDASGEPVITGQLIFGTVGEQVEPGAFEKLWKDEMPASEFKKQVQGHWEGVEDREIREAFVDSVRVMGPDGVAVGLDEFKRQEFLYAMEMQAKGYILVQGFRRRVGITMFYKKVKEMEEIKNKASLKRIVYGKMMNGRSWTRRYEEKWKRSLGKLFLVDLSKFPIQVNVERVMQNMLMYGFIEYSSEEVAPSIHRIDIGRKVLRNRVRQDREYFAKRKAENKKGWYEKQILKSRADWKRRIGASEFVANEIAKQYIKNHLD